jgi:hypothetical protein
MGIERFLWIRTSVLCVVGLVLAACSSDSDRGSSIDSSAFVISGSIGDGPIVNADVSLYDADGQLLGTAVSSEQAGYSFEVPADTALPVTLRVSGGTDLVTQRAPDFELMAVVTNTGEQTVNVSPLTTLAVRAAQCANDLSKTRIDQIWPVLRRDLNIGLDDQVLENPLTDVVDTSNIATAVLANEALGEWVRRTGAVMTANGVSLDSVVAILACDLADGAMDGQMLEEVGLEDDRVLAVAKAVEVGIRIEVMAGRLKVDGQDATSAMNQSILTVMPEGTTAEVGDVPLSADAIDSAIEALGIISGVVPDAELVELMVALQEAGDGSVSPDLIDAALTTVVENTLDGLADRVSVANTADIDEINDRADQVTTTGAPIVSFSADRTVVEAGGRVTLSWATNSADQCRAYGGWIGNFGVQGTYISDPIERSTRFALSCSGLGGVTTRTLDIRLESDPNPTPDPDPQPEVVAPPAGGGSGTDSPTVNLSVDQSLVDAGARVVLNWDSSDASSCTAGGGWSGTRATQGSETSAPLQQGQTFSLNCSGPGGNSVAMVSVRIQSSISLAWEAPVENVDGSPIAALSNYRIHYGERSGQYSHVQQAAGTATSHLLQVPSGTYYIAMTAIDGEGNESGYSNEVVKQAE